MQNHKEEVGTKKNGFFKWLLYMIVTPALFAAVLFAIVFNALGYDVIGTVKEASKNIPFISSSEEANKKEASNASEASKLETKNQKQEEEIAKLKKDLEQKQADIRSLEVKLNRATSSADVAQNVEEEALAKTKGLVKKVTQSYEEMKPKQAAKIVQELPTEEAVKLLARLKPDVLAAILENIDSKQAATYTSLLTKEQTS
ncbi:hypothetical protein GCM10007140_14630 [Priestia taiwanensis]|uniref:Magnesium transporter MgtE intracellular domain-containing protein n=2 Tax=Priestia taiwanensis TaxID=1347902 RepID=A0A917APE6_9BACI|nr:hypothetical protein GCM10007140_14630 [Priestia taiwanensis]